MAFKILSQNEIDNLSEPMKQAYLQEYNVYLKRKAFVDRLIQLENVKMPSVSINKKRIRKVKAPSLQNITISDFSVDNQTGVELLNATKMVTKTLESNAKARITAGYKAELPVIDTYKPENINVDTEKQYKVEATANVYRAMPSEVKYEDKPVVVEMPSAAEVSVPKVNNASIEKYEVTGVPNKVIAEACHIDVALNDKYEVTGVPDVVIAAAENINSNIEADRTVKLEAVPIAVSPQIDAEIKEYEVSEVEKVVLTVPEVSFTEQEHKIDELSAVSIPKPYYFSGKIKTESIDIRKPVRVDMPGVNVNITPSEIKPLDKVVIPEVVSTVRNIKTNVQKIETPDFSIPDNVKYVDPEYQVEKVSIPSVSVPKIDAEAAVNSLLAKIR